MMVSVAVSTRNDHHTKSVAVGFGLINRDGIADNYVVDAPVDSDLLCRLHRG